MSVISAVGRLRQEDHETEARLGHIVSSRTGTGLPSQILSLKKKDLENPNQKQQDVIL
jgi:hypothetical protein